MKKRLMICLLTAMILAGCSSQTNKTANTSSAPAKETSVNTKPTARAGSKSPDKITDTDKKEVTKLINQQIKMLYKDGQSLSEDDIQFAKDDGVITATCTVEASSTEIPATFKYNDDGKDYTFITSDFGKTVARKETKTADDEMTEKGSFDVTVRSSITVTLNVSSGHCVVYAESPDGTTKAQIADVNGPQSGTYSATLEAGKYKITLYGDKGASYSWRYSTH